jgi:hypothetical protein
VTLPDPYQLCRFCLYSKEADWKADYLWAEPANAYETLYYNALS